MAETNASIMILDQPSTGYNTIISIQEHISKEPEADIPAKNLYDTQKENPLINIGITLNFNR